MCGLLLEMLPIPNDRGRYPPLSHFTEEESVARGGGMAGNVAAQ